MKTLTIISTEEFENETVLFMSDCSGVKFETSKLIDHIIENEMNLSEENKGSGLTCDPNSVDDYHVNEVDANLYLDVNFDAVVESYYSNVLNK